MHGLATFLPLLSWLTVIGPDAWVLVALLEAAFLALTGALLPGVLRLPGWPFWVACLWVAQEAARDRLPFGGFPWGRLAFAETASPFTAVAALGGAPLVTFATALSARSSPGPPRAAAPCPAGAPLPAWPPRSLVPALGAVAADRRG